MNPVEQVWTNVRMQGFKKPAFQTLAAVEDRLREIVNLITHEVIILLEDNGLLIAVLKGNRYQFPSSNSFIFFTIRSVSFVNIFMAFASLEASPSPLITAFL